jgi:N utilization substance protein B
MLSRRHLRIRVMQALYAYYQSESKDLNKTEEELLQGTRKIFELYLMVLQFFLEITHQESIYFEDQQASAVTGIKKKANHLIGDIPFIKWLSTDRMYLDLIKRYKISWQNEIDTVKKSFFQIRQSETYKEFSEGLGDDQMEDKEFMLWLYKELFVASENVRHLLEEKTIYWAESLELVEGMIAKTTDPQKGSTEFKLIPLFKDEEDDMKFMKDLIRKTIRDDAYFQQLVGDKTKNWDADRIALIDIILMKMALCEILNIESIPVKVSINEYIDISKDYSTPNSKAFINGVIDKLVIELREQGKINKTGRGLVN